MPHKKRSRHTKRGIETPPKKFGGKGDAYIATDEVIGVVRKIQREKIGGSFLVSIVGKDGEVITMKRSKASKGGRAYPITTTGHRAEQAFHEKAGAVNETMRSAQAATLSGWSVEMGRNCDAYRKYRAIMLELERQGVNYYGDEHVRNGLRTLSKKRITRDIVVDGDVIKVEREDLKPAPLSSRGQALTRTDLRTGKTFRAKSKVAKAFCN